MITIEQARSGGGETRALSGSASLHCLTSFTHGFCASKLGVLEPLPRTDHSQRGPTWRGTTTSAEAQMISDASPGSPPGRAGCFSRWEVPQVPHSSTEKRAVEQSAKCETQGATVDGVLGLAQRAGEWMKIFPQMVVSINGGTHKWMAYDGKSHWVSLFWEAYGSLQIW